MKGIQPVATFVMATLLLAACDLSAGPPASTGLPPVESGQTPRAETVGPLTAGPAINLASLVVSPDAAPLGMHHDETGSGRDALTMLIISGREAEFAALEGFVDARWTKFSGDAGALVSLAMAFEDSLTGDLAFHRFESELRSEDGYGFGAMGRAGLGFEGRCDTGANPALDGLIETICIWRERTLILFAGGPLPPDDLGAIAAEMDARLR
jgi:hypothetical protein